MRHNCVQMLIFKQRSIRCTLLGHSAPAVLMKSSAGAERWQQCFGLSWMEELHMTLLTWLSSSLLAEFQELNTDPLSLLYKLGTLSMEKLSSCGWSEEPTSEKMNLVIMWVEEQMSQTPLSWVRLHSFFSFYNSDLNWKKVAMMYFFLTLKFS